MITKAGAKVLAQTYAFHAASFEQFRLQLKDSDSLEIHVSDPITETHFDVRWLGRSYQFHLWFEPETRKSQVRLFELGLSHVPTDHPGGSRLVFINKCYIDDVCLRLPIHASQQELKDSPYRGTSELSLNVHVTDDYLNAKSACLFAFLFIARFDPDPRAFGVM